MRWHSKRRVSPKNGVLDHIRRSRTWSRTVADLVQLTTTRWSSSSGRIVQLEFRTFRRILHFDWWYRIEGRRVRASGILHRYPFRCFESNLYRNLFRKREAKVITLISYLSWKLTWFSENWKPMYKKLKTFMLGNRHEWITYWRIKDCANSKLANRTALMINLYLNRNHEMILFSLEHIYHKITGSD